ncbi:MAG: S-layer homology domain-containing protein [Bacillota bacterium]|nr:S-layer homology domain-containing protein [Bacillota bacterium]
MKKVICLFLVLVLLVSLVPSVFADAETITGTFSYIGPDNKTDCEQDFTYSDEYFTKSGYVYRHDLAKMSLCFSQCCGIAGTDYAAQADSTKAMMDKCGFVGFEANKDYLTRPTENSMGVSCANKTVRDNYGEYTLIAVMCRGFNYHREWCGNTIVGESGDHEGFAIAANTAISFIKQYISEQEISGRVKVWITGYSRGGTIANMVGGMLDNGYDLGEGISLNRHDLYAYCFEPPMGVDSAKDTSSRIYGNIHNIVNPCDLVPYVAPEYMGFARYGVDHYLPAPGDAEYDTLKADMLAYHSQEYGVSDYTVDNFKYVGLNTKSMSLVSKSSGMTLPEFYPLLLDALERDVVSDRAYYVEHDQETLKELCAIIFGLEETQGSNIITAAKIFAQLVSDNSQKLLKSISLTGKIENGPLFVQINDMMLKAAKEADLVIDVHTTQEIAQLSLGLAKLITKLAINDPDILATAVVNVTKLIECHFPEVTRAWMMTLPEDYIGSKQEPVSCDGMYSDISDSTWCAQYVEYMTLGGMMLGMGDGSFAPDKTMNRAMFVTVLYRLEGCPSVAGMSCPFKDVTADWYKDAVIWAYNNGIVLGTTESTFSPYADISREQMAAIMYRYAAAGEALPAYAAPEGFSDYSSVASYAKSAINWAVAEGIINGKTADKLDPKGNSTRGQIAAVIYRFCEA